MSQKIGFAAEEFAREYLVKQGLRWVANNYSCRVGEIDLIMRDGEYLVFVEVRARGSNRFGGALASITHSKRQKIIKTALYYLLVNKLQDKFPLRFDVICLDGIPLDIKWLKNAFGSDY